MRTLLVAEQHLPTLEHLKALLVQAGYKVHTASDPAAAMELFVSMRPDGVVIAVDFPVLEGSHVGMLIRATDQGEFIPLVAVDKKHLGRAKGQTAIYGMRAHAYVSDPLKPNDLVVKLQSIVSVVQRANAAAAKGLQLTLGRAPIHTGELRKVFPLPALLLGCHRNQRDGVLAVAYRHLTRRVFFLKGVPVNYDSTARQDSLADYLLERGDLSEAQAERVRSALSAGMRMGHALHEAGSELEGEELLQRLREFTRDKVAQVVGMREGRYAFYAGDEFSEDIAAVDIPALAPILDGPRRTFPIKVFAESFKGRMGEYPFRAPEFGKDLPAMGLNTKDLSVAMQMNGRVVLKDLIAYGRGDLRLAYSLLWFLDLAGVLGFSKTPLQSTTGEPYSPVDQLGPRKKKVLPAATVKDLRDSAVKIITGSYFRVLGLDIAADTDAVERAYHQIATKFHPDSYPEYDTSEIQDLLDSVMDKLSASYRVLASEEKRKAYLQYLISRLDVARSTAVNVDAEIAIKRGESALRRKDPQSALHAFSEAVSLNPKEPEYYCYLAWATYLAGEGQKKDRAKAAQKLLKKALGMNTYLERALVMSAIIEGDLGEREVAKKKLRKVLELNPRSKLAKAALLKLSR